MTYINAVKYLLSLSDEPLNDPLIIERMRTVCDTFGNPQKHLKSVHICGDVGKDSCSQMLSSILRCASYRAGIHSVSHSDDFRSCISVSGKPISYAEFADTIKSISKVYKSLFKEISPGRNEILILSAILFFCKSGCDIAIFEKSYSKNDPANITDAPMVSLITPLTERTVTNGQLDSLIQKGTTEIVSSPQHKDVYNAISDVCSITGSRLTVPVYSEMEIEKITLFKTFFKYRGYNYSVRSFSPCQTINAITTIEVARALNRIGAQITDEMIAKGLSYASLDGKCEAVSIEPTIILSSSCEKERLDTLFASLSQIKEQLPSQMSIYIDNEADISISEISGSLSAYGIPFIDIRSISECDVRDFSKNVIASLNVDESSSSAAIFIGTRDFISKAKTIISECLSS